MAAIAKLRLDNDAEMTVLQIRYQLNQGVDGNNRINSVVKGGIIHMVVESSDNEDIHTWAASNDMAKSGEVVFKRQDTTSAMRKLTFKNAHCIQFSEEFHARDNQPMVMTFTLSAEEISTSRMTHTNKW